MTVRRTTRAVLLLGGAAIGIAIQLLLPCPRGSMLWGALFDAGHIPLYGLIALAALHAWLAFGPNQGGPRLVHYTLAFAASLALGALTEVLQAMGLGDGDIRDLTRDALGSGAFLLLALAFDRRVAPRAPARHARRLLLGFLEVALLAAAFVPLTTLAVAYVRRDAAFPLICDFEDAWEGKFVRTRDAELEIGPPPAGWSRNGSPQGARITFSPRLYPALLINEPYPDWRGYDQLVFDVYSELDATVTLVLRIDDTWHNEEYSDRFHSKIVVHPGENRVVISLTDVEGAPRDRKMDMERLRSVVLFTVQPKEAFSVWVDALRLVEE